MPLCVIRHMDEQSSDGRRQMLLAHGPCLLKIYLGQRSHSRCPISERSSEFSEQFLASRSGIEFRPQTSHLLFTQAPPFGISQQTIQTARQMPYVKGNRSRPRNPQIQLGMRKIAAPFVQVFIRQSQRVQDGARDRWNISLCTAQPRFD